MSMKRTHANTDTGGGVKKCKNSDVVIVDGFPMEIFLEIFKFLGSHEWHYTLIALGFNRQMRDMLMSKLLLAVVNWRIRPVWIRCPKKKQYISDDYLGNEYDAGILRHMKHIEFFSAMRTCHYSPDTKQEKAWATFVSFIVSIPFADIEIIHFNETEVSELNITNCETVVQKIKHIVITNSNVNLPCLPRKLTSITLDYDSLVKSKINWKSEHGYDIHIIDKTPNIPMQFSEESDTLEWMEFISQFRRIVSIFNAREQSQDMTKETPRHIFIDSKYVAFSLGTKWMKYGASNENHAKERCRMFQDDIIQFHGTRITLTNTKHFDHMIQEFSEFRDSTRLEYIKSSMNEKLNNIDTFLSAINL